MFKFNKQDFWENSPCFLLLCSIANSMSIMLLLAPCFFKQSINSLASGTVQLSDLECIVTNAIVSTKLAWWVKP